MADKFDADAAVRKAMHLANAVGAAWARDEMMENPRTFKAPTAEQALREYLEQAFADAASPTPSAGHADIPPDEFRGDTAHLVNCIGALLNLDKAGALAPHGIGGHVRTLLAAAANRLAGYLMERPQEDDSTPGVQACQTPDFCKGAKRCVGAGNRVLEPSRLPFRERREDRSAGGVGSSQPERFTDQAKPRQCWAVEMGWERKACETPCAMKKCNPAGVMASDGGKPE